MFKNEEIK